MVNGVGAIGLAEAAVAFGMIPEGVRVDRAGSGSAHAVRLQNPTHSVSAEEYDLEP